jgi:hypothetical protein
MGKVNIWVSSLPSAPLSDHLSRLYEPVGGLHSTLFQHIDIPDATIIIRKAGKVSSAVMITEAAVRELLDDMDYQIEFATEPSDRAYRNACRRMVTSVKKQQAEGVAARVLRSQV